MGMVLVINVNASVEPYTFLCGEKLEMRMAVFVGVYETLVVEVFVVVFFSMGWQVFRHVE